MKTLTHNVSVFGPAAVSKGDLDILVGVELRELEGAIESLTTLAFKGNSTR